MNDLDDRYTYYDFSIFGGVTEDNEALPSDMTDNIPNTAVDIAQHNLY